MAKRKKKQDEPKKLSIYVQLSNWINDGNLQSIPNNEIMEDKTIGPQYLLYYFMGSSYILYLANTFNNFNIFQMPRIDAFKLIKEIVYETNFKPKYIPRYKGETSKILKCLKAKYPYLKKYEVAKLVDKIDDSGDRDSIYESFGLEKPRSKRTLKDNKTYLKEHEISYTEKKVTMEDFIENFNLVDNEDF